MFYYYTMNIETYQKKFNNLNNKEIYKMGFDTIMKKNKTTTDNIYNYNYYYGNTQRAEYLPLLINTINKSKNKLNILDIGGGSGSLIEYCLSNTINKNISIDLIEPIETYVKQYYKISKKHNININNDFQSYEEFNQYSNKKYDFILLIHSIYYFMDNVESFVTNLKKILNKDGKIIILFNDIEISDMGKFENIYLKNYNKKISETKKLKIFLKKLSNKYIKQDCYFYSDTIFNLIPTLFIYNIVKPNNEKNFDINFIKYAFNYIKENITIENRNILQKNLYRLYQPHIYIEISHK